MTKESKRACWLVPLMALVLAFAVAPAAFAAQLQSADLGDVALQLQDDTDASADPNSNPGVGVRIKDAVVTFNNKNQVYTGKELEPTFTATLDGQKLRGSTDFQDQTADFYYFYMNNINVSNSSLPNEDKPQVVLATFPTGEDEPAVVVKEAYFNIKPASVKSSQVKVSIPNQVYTGKQIKPGMKVTYNGMTLVRGTDYTVTYGKNIKIGKGSVKITGKGSYTGTRVVKFNIKQAKITDATFSRVADRVYTGKAIAPNVKVKLKGKTLVKGKDYTITYKRNTNAGVAAIRIDGKNNLRGTHVIRFTIEPAPIDRCSVSLQYSNYAWTGNFITPRPTIKYNGRTLRNGTDYTLSYANNAEITIYRVATVYVNARGNFTGSTSRNFAISKRPIANNVAVQFQQGTDRYNYTGLPIEPPILLKYNNRYLVRGVDYTLYYYNNKDRGTGYVQITGIGDHFTGTRTVNFYIV